MIIELYAAPATNGSEPVDSPISNTTGELPDQEPTLDLGDLLGSFDSQEEAIAFAINQLSTNNQAVTDSRVMPFNAYSHVDLLTLSLQTDGQSGPTKNYYLVSDQGY